MRGLHLARAVAIPSDRGRLCANCGDCIDPIDWCPGCQTGQRPCLNPHTRLRKRSDAAFCDPGCRHHHRDDRASAIRLHRT